MGEGNTQNRPEKGIRMKLFSIERPERGMDANLNPHPEGNFWRWSHGEIIHGKLGKVFIDYFSHRWKIQDEPEFLGITFLGIGLWAWNEKGVLSNISSITDLGGFDPVWLFLVVGGVMFILGFAGCIGALRENTFLLKFFSVFLGIIFFLELTAGVLAFVFKDWIKDQLYFFINNNIRAYRDDIDLQNLIDFTQEYWQCCGAFGADDWNLNIYFNCTDSNASRERCGVPFSCCTKDPAEDVINTQCGYDARQKPEVDQQIVIYTKGCVPQFEKWLQDNLTIVAGIFIGIALLQIFGICLAQNLVSDIEAVRASW
ncbi:tetraspanin-5 isoform X1 [Macrotis lagotis]|uniref:tetraspanin-5 isoform X1 n=1 Tax=Macrotis lagotis TaxID=92651 RepID=UPI003D69B0D8